MLGAAVHSSGNDIVQTGLPNRRSAESLASSTTATAYRCRATCHFTDLRSLAPVAAADRLIEMSLSLPTREAYTTAICVSLLQS